MKFILFGDGEWAAGSLLRLRERGHEALGVVIRRKPSSDALTAAARGLGIEVLQPENANAPDFVEAVRRRAPELNVSVSYDQILRRPIRETARHGFINLHAGKLPQYRGRNVINWALINGETEIGITSHFVDDGIDSGDIILQKTLPIGWTDSYGDVLERVVAALPDVAAESVSLIESGRNERRPQPPGAGTYFGGRREGDEWLDWADTSRNLHNKVRAISRPGPGARTLVDGSPVVIWRAYYDPGWPNYMATPGEVVGSAEGRGVFVKTGDSTLLVEEAQAAGGACREPSWRIGTRLGKDGAAALTALLDRLDALERGVLQGEPHGGNRTD
jgi:methionyl-tRNA formyltransferase